MGVIWGVDFDYDLSDEQLDPIRWFTLDSELGEELVIEYFVEWEIEELSDWRAGDGMRIDLLYQHVMDLVAERHT